jgi:hypothetical protein
MTQPPEFIFIVYNVMLNTDVLSMLPQPIYKLAYTRQGPPPMGGTSLVILGTASVVSGITIPLALTHNQGRTQQDQGQGGCQKGTFQANLVAGMHVFGIEELKIFYHCIYSQHFAT